MLEKINAISIEHMSTCRYLQLVCIGLLRKINSVIEIIIQSFALNVVSETCYETKLKTEEKKSKIRNIWKFFKMSTKSERVQFGFLSAKQCITKHL